MAVREELAAIVASVVQRNPGEGEFHQAVREVLDTVGPALTRHPEYAEAKIIERICEPERQVIFRVPWEDGRSDREVMRFCQSFMTELYRHIGEHTDVPAGDIGVGGREIGFLFGQYKRVTNRYESGVLTGKGLAYGGAQVRREATGYGAVFFAQEMLGTAGDNLDGKRVVATFVAGGTVWEVPCELAIPYATQNEISAADAAALVANGCTMVVEGANMPTTPDAVRLFARAEVRFAPGKAANAGGVAASALEMQQNASRDSWTFSHSEQKLQEIMRDIHARCFATAEEYGMPGNYVAGANIDGFRRVAEAMLAHGLI
ncbi:MAG: Glutamate dehydrogenase [Dactylosporangium sp.]|nr:Glutamate dehydrogenase [Dactylosporangium sp.]